MGDITGRDEVSIAESGATSAALADLASRFGLISIDESTSIADWEKALLALRQRWFGEHVDAELQCTACGEFSALSFNVSLLSVNSGDENQLNQATQAISLMELLGIEAHSDAEHRLTQLTAQSRCIDLAAAAALLSGPDAPAVVESLEIALSGLDLVLATECVSCGAAVSQPFDVQAFVSEEINRTRDQIFDDIHRIACHYHWSEEQIVAMPRRRRRRYLSMIDRDEITRGVLDG